MCSFAPSLGDDGGVISSWDNSSKAEVIGAGELRGTRRASRVAIRWRGGWRRYNPTRDPVIMRMQAVGWVRGPRQTYNWLPGLIRPWLFKRRRSLFHRYVTQSELCLSNPVKEAIIVTSLTIVRDGRIMTSMGMYRTPSTTFCNNPHASIIKVLPFTTSSYGH